MMLSLVTTLALCTTLVASQAEYQKVKDVEVTLPIGTLLGETVDVGDTAVDVFKGIPYGTAPTGLERFKKTTPFGSWGPDTWNATYFRSPCMQRTRPGTFFQFERSTFSEDCLNLNIYAPSEPSNDLATMVWIHGGSFTAGSGGQWIYDGAMLAAMGDVIVVTFNYRLGSLGFLYSGDADAPGNAGMWDVTLALEWVQEYIQYFGGSSLSVTLFGESAGGAIASLLSVSPTADDLFDKIIAQSGNALVPWAVQEPEGSLSRTRQFANVTGCERPSLSEMVDCIRNLDVETLLEFERSSVDNYPYVMLNMPWAPTIDGDLIPDHPVTLLKEKKVKQRPMLIGDNKDEATAFITRMHTSPAEAFPIVRDQYEDYLRLVVDTLFQPSDLIYDVVVDRYSASNDSDVNREVLVELLSDSQIMCPNSQKADLFWEVVQSRVFRYQLTQRPSFSYYFDWLGVTHAIDIPLVFGNPWWPNIQDKYVEDDRLLSEFIMKAWASFAKSGSPTSPETSEVLPKEWLEYDSDDRMTFLITTSDDPPTHQVALKSRQCAFWNSLVPKLMEYSDALECASDGDKENTSGGEVCVSGVTMTTMASLLLLHSLINMFI